MAVVANTNYNWLFWLNPRASDVNKIEVHNSTSTFVNNIYNMDSAITTSLPYIEIIDLDELIDFRFKLKKSIKVKITKDELDTIGEIPELDIYAFGNNQFEVLREINKDITELFEEIFEHNENQLGTMPKKWKMFLKEYIEKEKVD
jgi:hypothetical protein